MIVFSKPQLFIHNLVNLTAQLLEAHVILKNKAQMVMLFQNFHSEAQSKVS